MRAGLILMAWLAAAMPGAAEVLTPEETRAAAIRAVAEGRPGVALALADALVARDGGDVTAHLVRSRALRDAGRHDAARDAAALAWRAAATDAERHRAALVTAQALSSAGRRTRAQLWLRRAAALAPDAAGRAAARRDFRFVRARNPLSVALAFDLSPTSNVNNGSTQEVARLFGLPFALAGASRALSGTKLAAGARIGYRLGASRRVRDRLDLTLFRQTYRLSDEARAIAPGAEGSDFAYAAATVGVSRRFAPGAGRGLSTFGATLGANWYGGDPLSRFARLDMSHRAAVGPRTTATVSGRVERQIRLDANDAGVTELALGARASHARPGGASGHLELRGTRSVSEAAAFDFSALEVGLGASPGSPVLPGLAGGLDLAADLSAEATRYAATPFRAGARRDVTLRATLSARPRGIERYGFAPTFSLDATDRASNVDLYDSRTLGIRLGIASTF